jgi:hypothetical protein
MMTRMIDSLEQFIELDTPFLLDERRGRLERLRGMMERSDVTAAEKFRRVIEAYQIENDYGRTIEAYRGSVDIDGNQQQVDFLRIGRISLTYQSVGGQNTGAWDTAAEAFVELPPEKYKTQVAHGIRVARKQVAPDLLIIPVAAGFGNSAFAVQAVSMDDLLQQVKQGRVKDAAENKKRIAEFQRNRGRQQQLVADIKAEQARQEQRSKQLEVAFEANDVQIIDLERALLERLGDLKELFGVLQQAAGDARGNFENSLTQIQFPERTEWLTSFAQKMGQTTRMPSMEEIERIWFELQREMTESGKILRIPTTVINASGEEEQLSLPTANTWSSFLRPDA